MPILVYMYNAIHNYSNDTLLSSLITHSGTYSTMSSNIHVIQRLLKSTSRHSIEYLSVRPWSALPAYARDSTSIKQFKFSISNHISLWILIALMWSVLDRLYLMIYSSIARVYLFNFIFAWRLINAQWAFVILLLVRFPFLKNYIILMLFVFFNQSHKRIICFTLCSSHIVVAMDWTWGRCWGRGLIVEQWKLTYTSGL